MIHIRRAAAAQRRAIISRKAGCTLLLLGTLAQAHAQRPAPKPAQGGPQNTLELTGRLDNKFTLIDGQHLARFNGVRGGVEVDHTYELGLGLSGMALGPQVQVQQADGTLRQANLLVGYASLFGEYNLLTNYRWQLSAQLSQGFGAARYFYAGSNEEIVRARQRVHITDVGLELQRVLHPYFGVAAGLGWRVVVLQPLPRQPQLGGPTAAIKVKIYFTEMWRDWRKRKNTH